MNAAQDIGTETITYALIHRTEYAYSAPASFAQHLLHLLPREIARQHVISAALTILPAPAESIEERDYFDNRIVTIELRDPHSHFEAVLEATVSVRRLEWLVDSQNELPWETIVGTAISNGAIAEFRLPSGLTRPDRAIVALATEIFAPGTPVQEAVIALMRRLYDMFDYEPGVTHVGTTAQSALARRAGVCQDYAHVMIAALRSIGLPARYVSGYLRSAPAEGTPETRGAEQTHAWVSVWLGEALGWRDYDPTNNLIVDADHIVLAVGRDFADVSPIRGIILGGGAHTPRVAVKMVPIADLNGGSG